MGARAIAEIPVGVRVWKTSRTKALHEVLEVGRAAVVSGEHLQLPTEAKFKIRDVGMYEAGRRLLDSERNITVARAVVAASSSKMIFRNPSGEDMTLEARMADPRPSTLRLSKRVDFRAQPVETALHIPTSDITLGHKGYYLQRYEEVGRRLLAERGCSRLAAESLENIAKVVRTSRRTGDILRGHKFVILGGDAQLSPTALLLSLGAEVLVVDRSPRPRVLENPNYDFTGSLTWIEGGANLLTQPDMILNPVGQFANGAQVHVLQMAYAAPAWELGAAMNAITRVMIARDQVKSVGTFISPTAPAHVDEEQGKIAMAAYAARKNALGNRVREMLRRFGLVRNSPIGPYLGTDPGVIAMGGLHTANTILEEQGGSYQGCQYLEKMMAALVFEADGVPTSSNVAGVAKTQSMWPFRFALQGASVLGARIFDAGSVRNLSGAIYVNDILAILEGSRKRFEEILRTQIHGGLFVQPEQLQARMLTAGLTGLGSPLQANRPFNP